MVDQVHNLMIVAHPDDETIWGGKHLITDKWLIVCLTYNKSDSPRGQEFCNMLMKTDNNGLMLGFPDDNNGKIDSWKSCRTAIEFELRKIISSKEWDIIVTHNPDGEYSHKHHILTSKIVTSITKKNLFYFGKYYEKGDKALMRIHRLDDKWVDKKKDVMSLYTSQGLSAHLFEHMYPYEHFIPYSEWRQYRKPITRKIFDALKHQFVTLIKKISWHIH